MHLLISLVGILLILLTVVATAMSWPKRKVRDENQKSRKHRKKKPARSPFWLILLLILAPIGVIVGFKIHAFSVATLGMSFGIYCVIYLLGLVLRFLGKPTLIKKTGIVFLALTALAGGIFVFGGAFAAPSTHRQTIPKTTHTTHTSSTQSTPPEKQVNIPQGSWKMVDTGNAKHDWVAGGLTAIYQAKTNAEAKQAILTWLSKVKTSPGLLAGAAYYLNGGKAALISPATLVIHTKDGLYASQKAVALVDGLTLLLQQDHEEAHAAPAGGINSYYVGGSVHASSKPGISGDRKAIEITLADGKKVWVMARCGNAVTPPTPTPPQKHHHTPPTPTPPQKHHHTPPTGKHASEMPPQPSVVTCPSGEVMDRNTQQCVTPTPPPSQAQQPSSGNSSTSTSNSTPSSPPPGKGDSGSGAVNTVSPPKTDNAPAPAPPDNSSPVSNPPTP